MHVEAAQKVDSQTAGRYQAARRKVSLAMACRHQFIYEVQHKSLIFPLPQLSMPRHFYRAQ